MPSGSEIPRSIDESLSVVEEQSLQGRGKLCIDEDVEGTQSNSSLNKIDD